MMYELPALTYDYKALGQYMSGDTLRFHHDKHHQTYVDKLNIALEASPELKAKSLEELLSKSDSLAEPTRKAIINNGGGHYNHSLFWQCMSPNGGGEPVGDVTRLIIEKYESYQKFVDEFTVKALGVFGSG